METDDLWILKNLQVSVHESEFGGRKMKEYQNLIGKIFIAIAIIIAAFIVANAIENAGADIHQGLTYTGELLR